METENEAFRDRVDGELHLVILKVILTDFERYSNSFQAKSYQLYF
jgi:hypothetical protein